MRAERAEVPALSLCSNTGVPRVSGPSLISGDVVARERGMAAEGGKGQINQGRHHFLQPFELLRCLFYSHLCTPSSLGKSFWFLPLLSSAGGGELRSCPRETNGYFMPLYCKSQVGGRYCVLQEKRET